MNALEISLFGKLHVRQGEQTFTDLDKGKAQKLLCYLLLYRARPHPREILASLFWGDSSTAQAKKYLRQALWQLNAALGGSADLLRADADWIRVETGTAVCLDVALFEKSYEQVRGVHGRDLSAQFAQQIEQALSLYQGDLLDGWYDDWCLYERERFRHMYLTMLDKMSGYHAARGAYEEAIHHARSILRYDRAHERAHRRLMRLYYRNRDRTSALRQYGACVAALQEELGVEPSQRTVALYEMIRDEETAVSAPASVAPLSQPQPSLSPPTLLGALPEVLHHLRHYQQALDQLQQQLRDDIQSVEHALEDG